MNFVGVSLMESSSSHSSSSQIEVQVIFDGGGDPVRIFSQNILFVITGGTDQRTLRSSMPSGIPLRTSAFDRLRTVIQMPIRIFLGRINIGKSIKSFIMTWNRTTTSGRVSSGIKRLDGKNKN